MKNKKFICIIIIICIINIICVNISYADYAAALQNPVKKEESSDGGGYAPATDSKDNGKKETEKPNKEEKKENEKNTEESNKEEKKESEKKTEEAEKESTATVDILEDLDKFKLPDVESPTFDKIVNNIVNIFQTVGSIASVVVLVVIGIQYMFGSIEEKAEYKKTMMPYIIGAVMVFGISNITGFIYNIAKNIF